MQGAQDGGGLGVDELISSDVQDGQSPDLLESFLNFFAQPVIYDLETGQAFGEGVLQGFFVDGLYGTATGIGGAIEAAGSYMRFVWRFYTMDATELYQTDPIARNIQDTTAAILPYLNAVRADLPILLGMKSGSIHPETIQIASVANELMPAILDAIAEELNSMSGSDRARLIGRIYGALLYEAALATATVGAGTAVSGAAKAGKFTRLLEILPKGMAAKVTKIIDNVADGLRNGSRLPRGAGDDWVIEYYGDLRRRADIPGQAHHLNQSAAFRSRIKHNDGVSVKLEGNAITDVGLPHYNAHETMEAFWDIYRRGGLDAGNLPTISQYNRALYNALQESGLSPFDALRAVQAAKRQQIEAGLRGSDLIPRLPRRMGQVPRGN